MWTIWKERNSRCFNNTSSSLPQLQTLILLRTSWWIKGWDETFPYTPNDVQKWAAPQARLAQSNKDLQAPWLPPPISSLKWNVDASINPSEIKASIGGVLRNHQGNFICVFSSPMPFVEINHAEILAIHRAIKIFMAYDHLRQSRLLVESDSINAVKWCNNEKEGPWNLNFIINFIRSAMTTGEGIELYFARLQVEIVYNVFLVDINGDV
ncbi:uncharacterized protein [Spinacia oleracea]|uniref:RNase H type-1 domain-containing protein n=1 Tax=Spinacia oleracea TaxID=3562 RepID=A0ABM3R3C1_SPIOL|nr:uncharacterized protein LOC130465238 [Spinacia oleracea]